jgi:hypothetical protein
MQGFLAVGYAPYEALQFLPADEPPAVPLRVELTGKGHPWPYELLHARESDPAWAVAGSLTASAGKLSFAVTEPGLWTVGQLPLPPSLQGRLQRVQLDCAGKVQPSARSRFLDLIGTSYTWWIPDTVGCYGSESGTVVGDQGDNCLKLVTPSVVLPRACFLVDTSGAAMTLVWDAPPANECGGIQNEHYVLVTPGTSLSPLPQQTQPGASCAVDAGGFDGGLD